MTSSAGAAAVYAGSMDVEAFQQPQLPRQPTAESLEVHHLALCSTQDSIH